MKIRNLFAFAFAALVMTNCSQEDDALNSSQGTPRTLTATIEGASRSAVTDGGVFSWTAGDAISVWNGDDDYTTITYSGTENKFNVPEGTTISDYAIYPSGSHGIIIDGSLPTVEMKSTYTYGSTNAIMMAEVVDGNDNLSFYHLGGLMRFVVKEIPTDATSFTFTANSGITGSFQVNEVEGSNIIQTAAATETNKTVTITFEASSEVTTRTFYVPLPVGTYNGFTIAVGEKSYTAATTVVNTIKRKSLLLMPAFTYSDSGLTAGAGNTIVLTQGENAEVDVTSSEVLIEAEDGADATVTLNFTPTDGNATLSVSDGSAESATSSETSNATVNVNVPANSTVESLDINAPTLTVALTAAEDASVTYNEVTALTAQNTLKIGKGVKIAKLTVKGGRVVIEEGATITEMVNTNNCPVEYHISTAEGLKAIATAVNAGDTYEGKTIKLAGDINLNNEEWTPIGNGARSGSSISGNSFAGTFDGGDHTISGLKITTGSGDNAIGLFGAVSGVISNVTLADVVINVSESELAGGAAGFVTDGGSVTNVKVSGQITAKKGVGGIVGRATKSAEISNCTNSATINATSGNAGGIVGAAYYTVSEKTYTGEDAALKIESCQNSGAVTTSGGGYTGGIAGLSSVRVYKCENTGNVTANGTSIGGIVGEQKEAGEVIDCTNSGNVTNNQAGYGTAGIIGWVRYPASEAGTGKAYEVQNVIGVKNNTNTGSVTGGNDAGGIVGTVYNYAVVTGNENSALTLSAANFAAGIVGSIQFDSANNMTDQTYMVQVTGNVSTTSLDQLTVNGTCKSLYAYDNSQGSHTNIAGNTGARLVVTTTEEAQAALDQAVEGTTIYLSANMEYGTLYIRPTANSNTTYKCPTHPETVYTNVAEFKTHMAESGYHGTPEYTTTLKDVTIVGAEGATVAGFIVTSGHAYGEVHDYVLDKEYTSGSAYYNTLYLTNLTFQNVEFTAQVNINTSKEESVYDGVNFKGCTFTTGGTESANGAAIRYYNEANNGNVKNIKVVDNCTFTNSYQGVYVHHVNGVTVTGSMFNAIGHNAIALQGHDGAVALKNVVITDNTFTNITDRIIRFNEVAADSNITIQNNTATNSGDDANEVMKATSIATGVVTNISGNNWGEGAVVVNDELKDR